MMLTEAATTTTTPVPTPCYLPGKPREPTIGGDFSFNTGNIRQLGAGDYALLAGALMIPTTIGISLFWRHRDQEGLDAYMLAGGSMPATPVAVSLCFSFHSALSLMGVAEEMYRYSAMYLWELVPLFCTIAITAEVYMPTLYNLKLTSSFEYLEMRFDRKTRMAAVCLYLLHMIVYLPLVLHAPASALNSVTGLSSKLSILSAGTVGILFVVLGGMKAVIWTDSFQAFFVWFGMIEVIVRAERVVGSIAHAWESLARSDRDTLTDFRIGPTNHHSVWSILVGMSCLRMGMFGINQTQYQKCQTCRSVSTVKSALWMSILINMLLHVMACILGFFMSAFYENCDPERAGFIKKGNALPLFFALDIAGGLPFTTFYLASLFLTAVSSFGANLTSMTYVIMEEVVKHFVVTPVNKKRAQPVAQVLCFLVGAILIELCFVAYEPDDAFYYCFILFGCFTMPLVGVYTLGMLIPHANEKGGICGLAAGVLASVFFLVLKLVVQVPPTDQAEFCISNCNLTVLSNKTRHTLLQSFSPPPKVDLSAYDPISTLSFTYKFAVIGTLPIVVGVFISYLTGFTDTTEINPLLIVPIFDDVFPLYFLPEKYREILRFNIDHTNKWEKDRLEREQMIPLLEEKRRSTLAWINSVDLGHFQTVHQDPEESTTTSEIKTTYASLTTKSSLKSVPTHV